MAADLVLLNGPVYTSNPSRAFARAVAISGETISYVGGDGGAGEHVGPETRVIDLAGRLVTAGFQDAHVHPGLSGLDLLRCSLDSCHNAEETVRVIAGYAAQRPDEPWILGSGWSQDHYPRGCPPKELLDSVVADRPAFLYNRDGHGAWVNSTALALAGVDADTEDPPDGRIERNDDGSPQGTLHEGATRLVRTIAPEDTFDDLRRGILAGQDYLLSKGVTAWQDAHVDHLAHAVYRSVAESGELIGRVTGALWWERHRGMEQVDEVVEMRSQPLGPYRPLTVKLMLDGVIENHSASLLDPYLDGGGESTGGRGIDFIERDRLREIVTRLDSLGISCHFHAIGDAAVRNALDAVEAARVANGWTESRHHIAHIQVIHPDDIPRFRSLGVVANAQPYWACDGGYQTELTKPVLGEERTGWQYPFGSLLRAGATMAMGSDWGVSTADVMAEADVAVTRLNPEEPDQPPLSPAERITMLDALTAFTAGSAYVNHLDHVTGTVEVGRLADLVVLDRDPIGRGRLAGSRVLVTIVGGRVVYEEDR